MKNTALKILLFSQTMLVLAYTIYVGSKDGWGLLQIFINDITSLTWNGQFDLDFSSYLSLSGIWIMWRNRFSIGSILFGIVATIMGIIVFAPYLLYLLYKENGNLHKVLLGDNL